MAFAPALLDWYDAQRRDLPWRRLDDAYAVLVSEIMLQQTQVARVVPLFEAFLARWPTVADLAASSVADVLRAWQGLGYNRRAVALHRAAQAIVTDHGGVVPADLESLRALPGIGDYTARAVLAFAFGEDIAPVDTNVRRVVQRALTGAPLTSRALQAAADAAVPSGRGRDWSAALMDLGATYCTARARCDACPLSSVCAWAGRGDDPAAVPARSAPPPFVGSTRWHRGRLLDALRAGSVARSCLPQAARVTEVDRAEHLAAALVSDGMAEWVGDHLCLPSSD